MAWAEFFAAILLFVSSHRIPAMPGTKKPLERHLGRTGYIVLFSVASTLLLFWVIFAAGRAPFVPLWDQAPWHRWAVNLLMPCALALTVFGVAAPNPFAFEGRANGFDPDAPGIAGLTRQPLLWALALWSGGHLLANGDLAHVILFGLFLCFSLAGLWMVEKRKKTEMGAVGFSSLARCTGLFPLSAMFTRKWRPSHGPSLIRAFVWAVVWTAVLLLHEPVIGVRPEV